MTRPSCSAWSSAAATLLTRQVQVRTKYHIIPHIVKFVKPGSKINTDDGSAIPIAH